MMPDKFKEPATSIVLSAPKVMLPEIAPVPVPLARVPPLKVIGSAPISARTSKVPPATVVPVAAPPNAAALVMIKVPAFTVVKPV